ncbi:hypothetical protein VAE308_1560002 [Vibrio aestuarianus]|nr:hypothetical protein VAE308_1560002 [Vibrio aestuarianus]
MRKDLMSNKTPNEESNVRLSHYLKGSQSKGFTTSLSFEDNFISTDDTLVSAELMKNWVEEQNRVLRRHVNIKYPKFSEKEAS